MDKQQAQNIIKATFENPFEKDRFSNLVKNLLNNPEDAYVPYRGNYVPDAYKPYISSLERIYKYSDGEHKIDILVVQLKKETSLERARTMQRNFIAWYLNGSRGGEMKDAALVAFVAPGEADWRFSLVKMDYRFEESKNGKIKVKEEFTPARRWSFLVGSNEASHTAQSRLVPILADDEHNPTLQQLEEAFNIETVTKEFFFKYRELFIRTKEALDKVVESDAKVKADFEAKSVDTVNFSKKLLGQIIFLYFLQKKGWFGVGLDDDWGTGSKQFLRKLFEKKHSDYHNFFNDILEPLFYEALRIDRRHDDDYYSRFNCKIPFLNGGLFDPIGNYDWVHTDIIIPNELFSNTVKTKEGDIGNGILDIFDRYNFTVREDEPLEKEVAIDPELLGKAYEKFNAIRPDNFDEFVNALKSGKKGEESKFNKKFGVYYTPREIVHYMCQQSLINYLHTRAGEAKLSSAIKKQDIENLIEVGEMITEHEAMALIKRQNIKNGIQKSTEYTALLSDSIRENAAAIDLWLADITVCDPAVGSGAFPVGMMNEIVRVRNVLSVFFTGGQRSDYEFKRRCIEHSLYGVDIDPGAVEIAKLRLWLSLVVDEEDVKNIKPLPNLDYRIMQGNSLISEFMGINFDTEQKKEGVMFKDETDELIEQFQHKKDEFLNESNVTQKTKLKEEVENLLIEIFETKLKTQKAEYFNRLKNIEKKYSVLPNEKQRNELIKEEKEKLYKESGFDLEAAERQLKEFTSGRKIKPFFLWNLYFSEVFLEKASPEQSRRGGFDVVIANPPYIKERDNKKVFQIVNNSDFGKKYHQGKMDYWYYFLHKAIDIVIQEGSISFITSRYWLNSSGAKKLINRVKDELSFVSFVDIGKLKVFDEVAGQHMVAVYQKKKGHSNFYYKKLINDLSHISNNEDTENVKISVFHSRDVFSDNGEIIFEKPFYDTANIIGLGTITEISQGVVEAPDKISNKQIIKTKKIGYKVGQGVFVLTKNEAVNLDLNSNESLVLKKYLDPKDVDKYLIRFRDKYLIYSDSHVKEKIKNDKNYSRLKNHLRRFKYFITSSNKPYGLHRPRKNKYFECPKIIFKNMFVDVGFSYDDKDNYYFGFSFSSIIQNDQKYDLKYILAILNSKFAQIWFYKNGKKRGAGVDIGVEKLRQFPVKEISSELQKPFISKVERILTITKDDDYLQNPTKQSKVHEYEKQIDRMVYDLYGLTEKEIKIVEGES